jgi:glucose-1-phosphate thymidylyltransferase
MLVICPMASVGAGLQNLTIAKPKTMLKVAGKRIIDHIMEKLSRTFPKGTKILFIVGQKKKAITTYISNTYSDQFDIIYHEQQPVGYKNDVPIFSGLGDAIGLAGDIGKNEDCFIFLSDHLPIDEYSVMIKKMEADQLDGVLSVAKVDNPKYYGVVVPNNEGIIDQIIEKPKKPISNLAVVGGYVFSHKITSKLFDFLAKQAKSPLKNGEFHQFTPIIQQLIDEGAKFGINILENPILDFGRPQTILDGNRYLLKTADQKDIQIVDPKKIINSTLISPVFLGKNCVITDSVIGPNVSIGDNVILNKCIIAESIIGDCSTLEKIITEGSIIGDFVTLDSLLKNSISIGDSSNLSISDSD